MKFINYILFGLAVVLGLSSCKENQVQEGPMGSFMLSVESKNPESRRAISSDNTGNFPVAIQGMKGSTVENIYRSYESVNSLPKEPILLPVGAYVVSAHTPGDIEKQMANPYFAGEKEAQITKDVTTTTTVVCKMKNSRILLKYNEKFLSTFDSWDITIDDGTGSVILFDETDLNPTPIYYYFGEKGVPVLSVSIKAKTKSGNTISDSRKLTKEVAGESYPDDNNNFVGGDGIDLNMDISEITVGNIGIKIDVNIAFTESQEDVDINIGDKEPTLPDVPVDPEIGGGDNGGDNGGGGDTPQTGGEPTIDLPGDFTYDPNKHTPETVKAVFHTPNGLESAKVKIETSNSDFNGILSGLPFDQEGALLKGAELIGNQAMEDLLEGLGHTPTKGVKEYTFPLGAFLGTLSIAQGTHTFTLTLIDQKGKSVQGSIVITI